MDKIINVRVSDDIISMLDDLITYYAVIYENLPAGQAPAGLNRSSMIRYIIEKEYYNISYKFDNDG